MKNKPELKIWDAFLNAWLTVTDKTEEEVRAEAERTEVYYQVDGILKSWKVEKTDVN